MTPPLQICFFILLVCYSATVHCHRHGRSAHRISKRQTAACDKSSSFRRADGQCNNLNNQLWGSASTIMDRIVASDYDDNKASPRTVGVGGAQLPSAREVSVKCHTEKDVKADVTLMVMQWGQFLDHDVTLTPHAVGENGSSISCTCTSTNPECFPIALSKDEYFTNRECLEFLRSGSVLATDALHKSPVRQHADSITAFIDASNVYGSSDEEMDALRDANGELKVTPLTSKGDYLPAGATTACEAGTDEYCFLAGDIRVNEQPGLSAMHTIFVREHNRIAKNFKSNTNWNDERVFQETRKIVGAIMQRITYNAFLPIVLGTTHMRTYGLDLSSYAYDAKQNPTIINAFATAAFRFGHTLIPEGLEVGSSVFEFKNTFFTPSVVLSSFNELAKTLSEQSSMGADRHFAHSVTRHLFQAEEQSGFDLVSLNIQRGRDHGLPTFNAYRKVCNLPPLTSLKDLFKDDSVALSAYNSIDDVDVFTGGISEDPVSGGLVGPTFACLLSTQFQRLKNGDRFFYLNTEQTVRFTREQLNEINRVILSKIICQNTENDSVQKNIFLPSNSRSNPVTKCDDLPAMSLRPWTDGSGSTGGGGRGGGDNRGPRRGIRRGKRSD